MPYRYSYGFTAVWQLLFGFIMRTANRVGTYRGTKSLKSPTHCYASRRFMTANGFGSVRPVRGRPNNFDLSEPSSSEWRASVCPVLTNRLL